MGVIILVDWKKLCGLEEIVGTERNWDKWG